jgi:uroporphyrinogen-III synthase
VRLLVTRPEAEARETARRLEDLGHEVLVQPLTRIVVAAEPKSVDPPSALAFTSRNGVRAVAGWARTRDWRDLPVFAVGAATAAAAKEAGFRDVRTGGGDVTRLAEILGASPDLASGPVLYPAARDRAGDLTGSLAEAGIRVVQLEAYQAVAAERFDAAVKSALEAEKIDAIMFYSRRSARVFVDLAEKHGLVAKLSHCVMLALSEQVAEPLRSFRPVAVRVAAVPEEAALIGLIPAVGKDGPRSIPPL